MVAFQQDLSAATGTHHAVAEVFEAGSVVAGAHEQKDRKQDDCKLAAAN
jgi:hypothetical protein